MGTLSPAARGAGLVVLATAALWVSIATTPAARADREHPEAPPTEPVEPRVPEALRPRTPVAPTPPATPAGPASAAIDARPPRSAFGPPDASLAVLARRPAGVLIGDHAIAITTHQRGGTWSSVSLTTGVVTTIPASVRILPSGTVGVLFDNAWPVGDLLVAHDGRRAMLMRVDGTFAPGATRPHGSTILGAASVGPRVIVWWRLDATHTELEALDRTTARTIWRQPGPTWTWDARMVADDEGVALPWGDLIATLDGASGASIGRVRMRALRSEAGWPHPFALGRGALVVADPDGVRRLGREDVVSTPMIRTALPPSILAADDTTVFAVHGQDLVATSLVHPGARWTVRVAPTRSLHLVPQRAASHLVVCDADGGAIVLDAVTGIALLRVGVGGCHDARALSDRTIAIAGAHQTWIVGPAPSASPAPARQVDGVVTLDGAPAAGLPVLIGASSYPIDGVDGCPPVPAYAQCVLTDAAGRFHASIRGAHGLLAITVDLDAAAHRAARPRAVGGSIEVDLDTAEPRNLRLDVTGADVEL